MTSTGANAASDCSEGPPTSAHFRRQYQNDDTVTRSREQKRATVRSDASNRRNRLRHSCAFT